VCIPLNDSFPISPEWKRLEPACCALRYHSADESGFGDHLLFVQEIVSKKDQPALRAHREMFEPQLTFVPASALAAAFAHSNIFARTQELLDTPFDKSSSHPAALMKAKCALPFTDASLLIFIRCRTQILF
jgi:hypothetical protein